ncbi:MAG: hypothetical protein WCK54_17420 [Desulfuromonadales bacterium]
MPGVSGIQTAVQVLDEREDLLADHAEHLLGLELTKARPTQMILPCREDRLLDRCAQAVGLLLSGGVEIIQPLDEQQERDLFDHP